MATVSGTLKGLVKKTIPTSLSEKNIVSSILGFLLGEDDSNFQFNPNIEASKFALANLSPAKIVFLSKDYRVLFANKASMDALSHLEDGAEIFETGSPISKLFTDYQPAKIPTQLSKGTQSIIGEIDNEPVWFGITKLETDVSSQFYLCVWEEARIYTAIDAEQIPMFVGLQVELVHASLRILDIDSALASVADIIFEGLGTDFSAIWLRSSRYDELMLSYLRTRDNGTPFNDTRLRKGMGIPGEAWETRRVISISTNSPKFRDPRVALNADGEPRTIVCIPVLYQKSMYGVLEFSFSSDEIELNTEFLQFLSILISDFIATSFTLQARKTTAEDQYILSEFEEKIGDFELSDALIDQFCAILINGYEWPYCLVWRCGPHDSVHLDRILSKIQSDRKPGLTGPGANFFIFDSVVSLGLEPSMAMPTIGSKVARQNEDVCCFDDLIALSAHPILTTMQNRGMNAAVAIPIFRGTNCEYILEFYTARPTDLGINRWDTLRLLQDKMAVAISKTVS